MSEALLAPLAAWQNYYVIIGTTAATLTGLMFVAITLMAQLRVHPPSWSHMRVFNTSTVVHFGATLLIAALLSAPWPALWTAALLLGLAGLALLSLSAACSSCWCEAACLAGKKGKARSELFEHCRQVFHSSWNSLFVGPGIAKDQPPARQRLQAIGRDGQDLNTDLRG